VGKAFKPALAELYNKYSAAAKFAYLRSKIEKFSGVGKRTTPSPHSTLSAPQFAPSALELGVPKVLF